MMLTGPCVPATMNVYEVKLWDGTTSAGLINIDNTNWKVSAVSSGVIPTIE